MQQQQKVASQCYTISRKLPHCQGKHSVRKSFQIAQLSGWNGATTQCKELTNKKKQCLELFVEFVHICRLFYCWVNYIKRNKNCQYCDSYYHCGMFAVSRKLTYSLSYSKIFVLFIHYFAVWIGYDNYKNASNFKLKLQNKFRVIKAPPCIVKLSWKFFCVFI